MSNCFNFLVQGTSCCFDKLYLWYSASLRQSNQYFWIWATPSLNTKTQQTLISVSIYHLRLFPAPIADARFHVWLRSELHRIVIQDVLEIWLKQLSFLDINRVCNCRRTFAVWIFCEQTDSVWTIEDPPNWHKPTGSCSKKNFCLLDVEQTPRDATWWLQGWTLTRCPVSVILCSHNKSLPPPWEPVRDRTSEFHKKGLYFFSDRSRGVLFQPKLSKRKSTKVFATSYLLKKRLVVVSLGSGINFQSKAVAILSLLTNTQECLYSRVTHAATGH